MQLPQSLVVKQTIALFIVMLALFQLNYIFFCNYYICTELVCLTLCKKYRTTASRNELKYTMDSD